jgi:hypothetical protein
MNAFEAQLIALAESMAEKLIELLIAKVEAKLGITPPVKE